MGYREEADRKLRKNIINATAEDRSIAEAAEYRKECARRDREWEERRKPVAK